MGKNDTCHMSEEVPVVHPIIKLSEDHFRRNTAFIDGRYQVLEAQREAYRFAPLVNFDDIVGLVFALQLLFHCFLLVLILVFYTRFCLLFTLLPCIIGEYKYSKL